MTKQNRQDAIEKPTIVHLGSKLEVRLGYVDPDGNVLPQDPLYLNLSGLSDSTFKEVQHQVDLRREAICAAIIEKLNGDSE